MKYFIADLHLHHEKLAELRGFPSTKEHDSTILAGLHALDPKNDQLWILGDICSGSTGSMNAALSELVLVKTPMYLVTGNHDPINPMHRDAHKHWPMFTECSKASSNTPEPASPDGNHSCPTTHTGAQATTPKQNGSSSTAYPTWGSG